MEGGGGTVITNSISIKPLCRQFHSYGCDWNFIFGCLVAAQSFFYSLNRSSFAFLFRTRADRQTDPNERSCYCLSFMCEKTILPKKNAVIFVVPSLNTYFHLLFVFPFHLLHLLCSAFAPLSILDIHWLVNPCALPSFSPLLHFKFV